ncbi:PPR: pentatricopeptide repeat domain containing protein [Nitzschia inconspicua]|uniref:PPR: pentatricopeptide repeat domain containing protein n=1 Tax=Nitzschia inconspicua TaxID=303405 RepID=A0A9K3LLR4_9STRA|nr:PPR: pentatricopeptide repeat domain containing protein [Nitzschia inconspicua]
MIFSTQLSRNVRKAYCSCYRILCVSDGKQTRGRDIGAKDTEALTKTTTSYYYRNRRPFPLYWHQPQLIYSSKRWIFQDHRHHDDDSLELRISTQDGLQVDDNGNAITIFQLLQNVPVGSLSYGDIRNAKQALETWSTERRPTIETFERAKFILMRLLLEQDHYKKYDDDGIDTPDADTAAEFCRVRPFLLNRVLDCWRRGWRNRTLNEVVPSDIIAWTDKLETEFGVVADSRALTLIIDGICLRGDPNEAPLLAQWLLDRRMEKVNDEEYEFERTAQEKESNDDDDVVTLRPDTILISNVIRAWAKSDRMEAPEMAEGLLEMMKDLYNNGWTDSGPNTKTYGVTMEAWYNSQRPEAAERIVSLLDDMKHSHLEQVDPDRVCYQYAINALVHSKTEFGVEQAYQLLQEMVALYKSGNDNVGPTASNFARVMSGYARQGKVENMEAVLEQLQDLYASSGDPDLQPNDECWKAVVIAKSKSGSPAEAQGVLDELIDQALAKDDTFLIPSRGYFVDTLVGWTKHSDQAVAAKQSHKVLNRMMELGKHPDLRFLLPDTKTFDKVILAWSRSRLDSAPDQIQDLMQRMESLGLHPNLRSYTNLMVAWQRSFKDDKIHHLLRILKVLKDDCNNGKLHLCPDRYAYGIVIASLSEEDGYFEEIETLFDEMVERWEQGNPKAKPDTRVFHNLLAASSKLSDGTAVEKCEVFVRKMRDIGCPMTLLAYGYLIRALLTNENTDQSISKASALLEEVLQISRSGIIERPSTSDYRQFLQIIANSGIPQRWQQARQQLDTLPRYGRMQIPRDLLPPFGSPQQSKLKGV